MDYRYVFVLIYLVVDVIYVTLSRSTYEKVATNIQGKGFPTLNWSRIVAVMLAYGSMVLGWLFLVVPCVEYYVKEKGYAKWKAGLVAGALYGLLVYGVFNGTNHVMFDGWDVHISLRDLLWGMSWASTLTIVYALVQ